MTGDKIYKHSFKNNAETPSGPVDVIKLIHHSSLKDPIKFISTVWREGKELFRCLI